MLFTYSAYINHLLIQTHSYFMQLPFPYDVNNQQNTQWASSGHFGNCQLYPKLSNDIDYHFAFFPINSWVDMNPFHINFSIKKTLTCMLGIADYFHFSTNNNNTGKKPLLTKKFHSHKKLIDQQKLNFWSNMGERNENNKKNTNQNQWLLSRYLLSVVIFCR